MSAARLPLTDHSPVLRTDFTDEDAWRALLGELGEGWVAVLAEPAHAGLGTEGLLALLPEGRRYPVLVVADAATFAGAERTLLLVDLADAHHPTVRVAASAFPSVIGNLAIQNTEFATYRESADASGVYRLTDRHLQAMADLATAAGQAAPGPRTAVRGPERGGLSRPTTRGTRAGRAVPGAAARPAVRPTPPADPEPETPPQS
ncbi:hypothetical protein AB0910_18755 [Streptomyces sp. NPDC047002]|uniref:DUF6924 domain-containing protein n=1 Tax=Streptomyces sp. NPDC047002 TaxID=3155475 RepID=UPI0034539A93